MHLVLGKVLEQPRLSEMTSMPRSKDELHGGVYC